MCLPARTAARTGIWRHDPPFQDLIPCQDQPQTEKVANAIIAARAANTGYRAFSLSGDKRLALEEIENPIAAFEQGMIKAVGLVTEGRTPAEVDATKKVEDGPATHGLSVLDRAITMEATRAQTALTEALAATKFGSILSAVAVEVLLSALVMTAYLFLVRQVAEPANNFATQLE